MLQSNSTNFTALSTSIYLKKQALTRKLPLVVGISFSPFLLGRWINGFSLRWHPHPPKQLPFFSQEVGAVICLIYSSFQLSFTLFFSFGGSGGGVCVFAHEKNGGWYSYNPSPHPVSNGQIPSLSQVETLLLAPLLRQKKNNINNPSSLWFMYPVLFYRWSFSYVSK